MYFMYKINSHGTIALVSLLPKTTSVKLDNKGSESKIL